MKKISIVLVGIAYNKRLSNEYFVFDSVFDKTTCSEYVCISCENLFLFSIFPSTTSIFFLWWQLEKNINALSWQVRTAIWWKYEIGSVVTTFGHLIKSHYYLGMLLYRVKRFWSILTMIRGANILSSQPTCFFCSYLRLLFRTGVGRLQTKCANKIVHIILLA